MSSEEKEEKEIFEKVKIYINLEPLGLKFGYVFKKLDTFQAIINFVYNQVKKLGVKFELGRIVENKTGAILLTENIIGDFLQNNDEITVYSDDYGFTRTNFAGEDEHNSLKKVYYLKSVSDLYKSMNFLKKKRNEKLKQKNNNNNLKKNEKKEEKEKKENKEKESEEDEKDEKEIELSEEKEEKSEKEENEEKVSSNKNKNDKKNIEKTDKKNKIEKKENKTEKKEKKIDEKEKDKEKSNKKNTEKKSSKKYSDDEDDDDD